MARTSQRGWVEANGGIDSPFVSLSSSDIHPPPPPAFHLTFRYAIYSEFASRLELVAALLLRTADGVRYSARVPRWRLALRKRLDFRHLTARTVQCSPKDIDVTFRGTFRIMTNTKSLCSYPALHKFRRIQMMTLVGNGSVL